MPFCNARCMVLTPSLHKLLLCLRYCDDDDDLFNDDDSIAEGMAFDDIVYDDCISGVDDDNCDEVSCD